MDEDGYTTVNVITPQRHDRWSVLIYALNWSAAVASVTAMTLTDATKAAIEHAEQVTIDRKFHAITKGE